MLWERQDGIEQCSPVGFQGEDDRVDNCQGVGTSGAVGRYLRLEIFLHVHQKNLQAFIDEERVRSRE